MKPKIPYVILILLYVTIGYSCVHGRQVEIEQGFLIGKEELSYDGRTYYGFRNIPFAEPPVGELRFQSPVPAKKWSDVLDARNEGEVCAQAALGFDEGKEDCLHLSVFTPKLPENDENPGLPVLVWLHGGAFVTGSAKDYSPHLLMDKDVVLVVPQYRLGVLGFYSSNTPFAPGNYGLLDQITALKWVQQNIKKFGGDPNRVTLGGDCAGGISSVLHMISPLSQDLFHRVISLSGSPLSTWAIHPRHNRFGLFMCNKIRCPPHDFRLMIECFRETPLETLLETQKYLLEARDILIGNNKLAPVIQDPVRFNGSNFFLEEHPLKLLLEGKYTKVPVLLSVTRDVGSYLVDMGMYDVVLLRREEDPKFLEKYIEMLVKEIDIRDYETEHPKFKDFYLPNWDYKNLDDAVPGFSKMLGDSMFNAPIITLAKILSKDVDTRLLRFDYEDGPKFYDMRHANRTTKLPPIPPTAVSHGDEMYFLFPQERFTLTKEQKTVVDDMLNIVDDFVHGRETLQEWPLFTANGLETTVIKPKGGIQKGIRFTNKRNEQFLHYISRNQHQKILEAIDQKKKKDVTDWTHDEL